MGIINRELFVNLLTDGPPVSMGPYGEPRLNQNVPGGKLRGQLEYAIGANPIMLRGHIDRESALKLYEDIRTYIGNRGYLAAKYLRPWELDDGLYDRLDRTEPWWGLEFETGWRDEDARRRAVYHTWDTWDNVVFDSEGEGHAAVEITFAPQEMSKYLNKTADAYKFAEFLTGNPDTEQSATDNVGMHINLSHPAITLQRLATVVTGLNRSTAHLPLQAPGIQDVRKHMFGRSELYGGFFHGHSAAPYIEGKLFRTTYEQAVFDRYMEVCKAITTTAAALAEAGAAPDEARSIPYVSNMWEVYTEGAEPVINWSINRGAMDGRRGNGAINGRYARDVFDEQNPPPDPQLRDRDVWFRDIVGYR